MRPSAPCLLLALFALLPACSSDTTTCGGDVLPAVVVKVVDAAGAAVPDARVTFTFNGGAEQAATCYDPKGIGACTQWEVYSDAGAVVLKARSADGTTKAEQPTDPIQNGCAVPTQHLTLTLR